MPNAHFPLSVRGSTTTTTELIATMEALQTRLVALQKGQPSATGPSPAVLYVRIRELARHIEALESERRRLNYQ
ncbi:hypothetical protein SPRG_00208 [Saprolegnia parasitica CBS 223.65]|uniref:Uncharacterized protein n=1 Tax=Saprolegnia parasitica (strain CBS 223.65) TaxID=695850 RepID=A0A067CXD1_SAPPC|nr:hypothetical protein SPRG_00208 [Saprolegnia parasitica CBS 223.65]KDO35359.1 hypothetical protein SPRG_00208 [Saprolegnia parasitica CBS 223.65]|eukprot:XP_012193705.1 hypothetical protein SPRG_00208 [Saprolegnia parasitica CBS 223.65]